MSEEFETTEYNPNEWRIKDPEVKHYEPSMMAIPTETAPSNHECNFLCKLNQNVIHDLCVIKCWWKPVPKEQL